jgi:hypothetical protein
MVTIISSREITMVVRARRGLFDESGIWGEDEEGAE